MKIFFSILLLIQISIQKKSREPKTCKVELLESYGISSFTQPIQAEFFLCPSLSVSCCSLFDQTNFYEEWHDEIKPKLNNYYNSLSLKFIALQQNIRTFFRMNINDLIKKLDTDDEVKEKIRVKYTYLKEIDLSTMLQNLIDKNQKVQKFMQQIKSTFFCTLCNYENHKYINIQKKQFTLSHKTCKQVSSKTIKYAQYLNLEVNTELMYLSRIITNFSPNKTEQPISIQGFDKFRKSVKRCWSVYKNKTKKFKKCKDYCELFNYNSNSPMIEGDPIFLSNINAQLQAFIKRFEHLKPGKRILQEDKQQDRVLQEQQQQNKNQQNTQNQQNQDVNKTNENIDNKDVKNNKKKKKLTYQQEIQRQNSLLFSLKNINLDVLSDPFVKPPDSYFNPQHIDKMRNHQETFVNAKKEFYKDIVDNKLYYLDSSFNFEKAHLKEYVKMNSPLIVDLENYKTKISYKGITLEKIKNNPFEKDVQLLLIDIKAKAFYQIKYEKLDKSLVELLNQVGDEDVTSFHKDNFMKFENYSLLLKKNEIQTLLKNYYEKRGFMGKGWSVY